MLELENRKVRCQSSLLSLLSHNTHTDVSHLNHPHIVTAIANPQNYLSRVVLDSLSNDSLLGRRNPAANDRRRFGSNSIEEIWDLMKSNSKGRAIDDEDSVSLHRKLVQFIFERIGLVLLLYDEQLLSGRLEPR